MGLTDVMEATVKSRDRGLTGKFTREVPQRYRITAREQASIRTEMREVNVLNNQVRAASEIAAAEFATS